jgi:Rrf2 family transcriptional regulator, iron-sulfur cluster assembly transcription factor
MPDFGLTQTAQYALRAMTCIAANHGRVMRGEDIAEHTGIPAAFLAKVLRKLVAGGLLHSAKGHHGGFTLARSPVQVRFLDVVEAVGGMSTGDGCVYGRGDCKSDDPCPLHSTYVELRHSLLSWAARHTLADVDLQRARPDAVPALVVNGATLAGRR